MKQHRKNGMLGFQTLLTIHRKWNVVLLMLSVKQMN